MNNSSDINIISFDIEEWYIEKTYKGGRKEKYAEFDVQLKQILNMLDDENLKATFFCVGQMAIDFPDVIKSIAIRGHEIGCHSHQHVWLNKMSREEVMNDTRKAVDALEQCVGEKVKSYRAPAFSIGKENLWAFEVLSACGIERDASIFPATRDFGGFSLFEENTPVLLKHNGVTLKEFPVSTTSIFGKKMVYSGGGYFRFFPLAYILSQMKKQPYTMTYFHIDDLIAEKKGVMTKEEYEEYFGENGNFLNRYKRFVKSNLGKRNIFNKLEQVVRSNDFKSVEQADEIIDWNQVKIIEL